MNSAYVHGYEPLENARLHDQAGTLAALLHADTHYPAGSRVLEAGCGVGAQTLTLAARSPGAHFTSVDVSQASVNEARQRVAQAGLTNVDFRFADARAAIACQIELQRRAGGNALIGRQLYPLMARAGLQAIRVSPRPVYADASRPAWVEGFTRKTFTAMIRGVREPALAAALISPAQCDAGLRDLDRTAADHGVFCYTFFKAVATSGA